MIQKKAVSARRKAKRVGGAERTISSPGSSFGSLASKAIQPETVLVEICVDVAGRIAKESDEGEIPEDISGRPPDAPVEAVAGDSAEELFDL